MPASAAREKIAIDAEKLIKIPDGLDWDHACLKPHENGSGVSTASAAQVRAPIHGGSVGRWRKWGPRLEPVKAYLQAEGVAVHG